MHKLLYARDQRLWPNPKSARCLFLREPIKTWKSSPAFLIYDNCASEFLLSFLHQWDRYRWVTVMLWPSSKPARGSRPRADLGMEIFGIIQQSTRNQRLTITSPRQGNCFRLGAPLPELVLILFFSFCRDWRNSARNNSKQKYFFFQRYLNWFSLNKWRAANL